MAIPTISAALQKRMKLSLASQGGDFGQELILLVERALEISTISLENATFTQETIRLNEGGTTASLAGSGTESLGDAGAVVAFMRVATDITNLEFKAPTAAGIMTLDINADSTFLMSANLSVTGVSAINQDVTSGADSTFGNLTITSFAANWTNAGRTIADLGIVTTADINGGTVDGATIGGSVAGAGTFTNLTASTDLSLATGSTVTSILDEDNMASNSATALVTQQSLVAFVASQIGANNELDEILANGNTTGANNIIVADGQGIVNTTSDLAINFVDAFGEKVIRIGDGVGDGFSYNETNNITTLQAGGVDFIQVSSSGLRLGTSAAGDQKIGFYQKSPIVQQLQTADLKDTFVNYGLLAASGGATPLDLDGGALTAGAIVGSSLNDGTVTLTSGTVTGTWVDLGSVTTADINGGTIDDTAIGASDAATGAFTTLSASGNTDIAGIFITSNTTTSSGAGAVAITGTIHEITTTGTGDALTLANGAEGQIIQAVYVAEGAGGDTAVLTPTALGGADSTITFNDLGDSVTLLFTAGAWYVRGSKDVVIA